MQSFFPAAAKSASPLPRLKRWLLALPLALAAGATAAQALPPPPVAARSWLLLDVTTGQVLAAQQPDMKVDPASLTKLMTAYLTFSALRDKRIAMDTRPPVSQAAWKAIGSRMFIDPAKPATVEELLNGMIVQSGNDASIALAEAVAGSEATFAQAMNREAKRLGMANSNFTNATGLPDPQHHATANDLAKLAVRIIEDFPQHYGMYSRKSYTYNGITQANRNRLLLSDSSVDGLKTGHTDAAGWCLVASAQRDQQLASGQAGFKRRLLTVVLGADSDSARLAESQKLLNYGFQNFDAVRLFAKGQAVGSYEVWKGAADVVAGGFDRDVTITVPKGQAANLKTEVERVQPLVAPIQAGQRIGVLRVKMGDQLVAERPLIAQAAVEQAGILGRAWDSLRLMLK